jgi:hypothetical protein
VTFRHFARHALLIVSAVFAERKIGIGTGHEGGAIIVIQDAVLGTARQLLDKMLRVRQTFFVEIIRQRAVLGRLAIDRQLLVFVRTTSPGTPITRLM